MGSEKEKMLRGELYDTTDVDLVTEREKAREIVFIFNNTFERSVRKDIIKDLFGSTGVDFHIESPFHCDYGYNMYLGENFYANTGFTVLDEAEVRFGDNVLIAPNVGIYTAEHPLDVEIRNAGIEYARPVTIGNNVWIGAGVTIIGGVTIGDNAVIGAGSVVTRDIPANVVAAGNPCKVIRHIIS